MRFLLPDLRQSARMLRKNPGFAAVAILALALGIGANTTIFSVINSLLLEPLPYRDPGTIVRIWQKIPTEDRVSFSPREFLEWRSQTRSFDDLSAATGNGFTLTGRGDPEMFLGQLVTPRLFHLLGVNPALGRVFLPEEGESGRDHVVVLSHSLWKSTFGADPGIVGQAITLNNEKYTVVGVMPAGFDFPAPDYRLWVPAALNGSIFKRHPDAHFLRVLGRLKPGLTLRTSQVEIDAFAQQLAREQNQPNKRLHQVPLVESETAAVRRPLIVLAFAVAFVLLIACANVANLLLARAASRQKEIAIRTALGAGRARIVAQMLTESMLLSVIGGACGFILAIWGVDALTALSPRDLPRVQYIHVDYRVLLFAIAISIGTGLLFGLIPAFTSTRSDANEALKQATRGSTTGSASRVRNALMFAEIALSCVLLIGAGLMLRSFIALQNVNPGFRADNVLTIPLALNETTYPQVSQMLSFYRDALDRLRALPGVDAAGMNTHLPFSGQDWGNGYAVEGHAPAPGESYVTQVRVISPGYLAAMGIPVRSGRDFNEYDNERGGPVILINETIARKFWANESPIGKRIQVDGPWRTIVGVVGSVRHQRLEGVPGQELYLPYPQFDSGLMNFLGRGITFVIHSSSDPTNLTNAVRNEIHALDKGMPVTKVLTLRRLIDDSVAQQRFRTWLVAIFTSLALVLACVGIYGIMSYNVTQRSVEFGIRVALGARPYELLRLVLLKALWIAVAGVLTGLAAAFVLGRGLATLLFEVKPHDAFTFAAVPFVLIAVALLASYLPARHATEVDPISALRQE